MPDQIVDTLAQPSALNIDLTLVLAAIIVGLMDEIAAGLKSICYYVVRREQVHESVHCAALGSVR
jgi:hypothetical protein